jgi:hypothetical protein
MELPELKTVVETMHGRPVETIPVIKACFDELFKNFTGRFLFDEFVKWTAANPAIVAPLHALQINIMSRLIGQSFWLKKQEERYADSDMKQPRYIFRFQQKICNIRDRREQSEALTKLDAELKKVRGKGAADKGRADRRNEMMDKLGLGEKKEQRRGVNMPGDLDLAIREGNEEILGGAVQKEEKKKPRTSRKSGKDTILPDVSGASNTTTKEADSSNPPTPATSTAAPVAAAKESRKTVVASAAMVSGKDKAAAAASPAHASGKESARTSRKTVLPPIQQSGGGRGTLAAIPLTTVSSTKAPVGVETVPSSEAPVPSASASAAASAAAAAAASSGQRRGRSTFAVKK